MSHKILHDCWQDVYTHARTHALASLHIHIMTMVLQRLDGPCTCIIYLYTT